MVALLIATAFALPTTQPKLLQWAVHPTISSSESHLLFKADSDTVIRLQCPDNISKSPQRSAVLRSDGAPAALASGPWSIAKQEDGYWYFPQSPLQSSLWMLDVPSCTIQILKDSVNSAGFARLEQEAGDEVELARWLKEYTVFSPSQNEWLSQSLGLDMWRSRYLTLRPSGPHPSSTSSLIGTTSFENEMWIYADDVFNWTLPNGQRHRIKSVFLGPRSVACLYINQTPHCQKTESEEVWHIEDGEPKRQSKRWQDQMLSQQHNWTIISDATTSNISIDGPVLVQIRSNHPQNYLWSQAPGPTVYPPSEVSPQGIEVGPSDSWESLTALNSPPVFMMEPVEKVKTPDSIWIDIEYLNRMVNLRRTSFSELQWLDESQHFSVWIAKDPQPSRCTLSLQDRHHSALIETTKVHRFLWLDDAPPTQLPQLNGCRGKIKLHNPKSPLANPTLRRRYHDTPDEGLYFNIDAAEQSWVRFTSPLTTDTTALRLEQRSGRAQDIQIQYLSTHTQKITDDEGFHWRKPISLQLDTGWDGLMIHSLQQMRIRISQPQDSEERPMADIDIPRSQGSPEQIRVLSQQLQQAQTDEERVFILERRALILAELGESLLALLDVHLADRLRQAPVDLLGELQSRRLSQILYPNSTWRPKTDFWLEDSLQVPLSDEMLKSAIENPLEVAKSLSSQGVDARYWWRKAILSGEPISRTETIVAYQQHQQYDDLTTQTKSYFWPLRTLSYDVPLYIRPRGVQLYRGVWPDPPISDDLAPSDALFEDTFHPLQRRSLDSDSTLIIPPQQESVSIALHCRPKSSRGDWGRCAIDIKTVDGEEQWSLESNIWGSTATLELPPSRFVRQITPPDPSGLLMELRLPEPDGPRDRSAWQLRPEQDVSFSVLGPTSLRFDTWSFDDLDTTLHIQQKSKETLHEQTLSLTGAQRHHVLIQEAGVVQVTIKSPDPVRVRLFLRDSEGGQLNLTEPVEQNQEWKYFTTDSRSSIQQPLSPPARPFDTNDAQRLRLISRWSPALTNQHSLDLTHFQRISEATRWWSGGLQIHQYIESVPVVREGPMVIDAHAGMDWLSRHGPNSFWLITDADLGFSLSEPLAAREYLRMTLRMDRWWNAKMQGIVRIGAQQYGQYGIHPEPYVSIVNSAYKRAHPYQLKPELEMRVIPSPWARFQWKSGLQSNPISDPQAIDLLYGVAMFSLGAPQRWMRLYTDIDQRFVDRSRSVAQQNIHYGAILHAGHWVKKDKLLEGRLMWESTPKDETWFIQTQISLTRSPNGLTAIRPTQLAMRHTMAWGFDEVNNSYWGILPPADAPILEAGPD